LGIHSTGSVGGDKGVGVAFLGGENKEYLRAEALAEFELAHIQLLNKFINSEINYDEYEKEIRNMAERIFGELRIV
jgi:hypothetical protein